MSTTNTDLMIMRLRHLFGKEMTLKIGILRPSPLSPSVEFPTFFIAGRPTMSLLMSSLAVALFEMQTMKMTLSIFAIIRPGGEVSLRFNILLCIWFSYGLPPELCKKINFDG